MSLVVLITGGFAARAGRLAFRARDPLPPCLVGLASGVLALALDRVAARDRERRNWADYARAAAPWVAAAATLATFTTAWHDGVFVAAGADAYGYVSAAHMLASGQLRVEVPAAAQLASRDLLSAFAPLAWRPALDGFAIVPVVSPGLPLVMAPFVVAFGERGAYVVIPLMAAACAWLTWRLGVLAGGRLAGVAAAVLLSCSPIFLYQAMQPMSDVAATTWWLLALVLAMGSGSTRIGTAGLASSMAVLTRPVLAPLAVVVGLLAVLSSGEGGRRRAVAAFVAGLLPGCLLLGVLQITWYGSPLSTGYGPAATLFGVSHAAANLHRYVGWLVGTQTVFVALAPVLPVAGLCVLASQEEEIGARRRAGRLLALFAVPVMVLGCYLLYTPFDDWSYLRFLLPGLPALLLLSVLTLRVVLARGRLRGAWGGAATLAVCALVAASCLNIAADRNVFRVGGSEARRYLPVADYVARELSPRAVLLAVQQSGSLRQHSSRTTLRWDMLEPRRLDATLAALRERGYVPYLVVEDWEEPDFRARFAGVSRIGALDGAPLAQFGGTTTVRIYGPL